MNIIKKILDPKTESIIAINGCGYTESYQQIVNIIRLNSTFVGEISGDSFINPVNIMSALKRMDKETFEIINERDCNDYYSFVSQIENIKTNRKYILVVNMYNVGQNIIAQLFSSIRDISISDTLKKNIKIILLGDWSHHKVKQDLMEKGISYPYVRSRSEYYLSQFQYEEEDYLFIKKIYPNLGVKEWQLLLDYLRGEILTTNYILDNLMGMDNLFDCYQEYFDQKCYDYYRQYISKHTNIAEIKLYLRDKIILNSLISNNEKDEDLIFRSNLFSSNMEKTGDRYIYRPINYFGEYILNQFNNRITEIYSPTSVITHRHRRIFNDANEIELLIKQNLKIYSQLINDYAISIIPLYASIYPKCKITTGQDILNEQVESEKELWEDEDKSTDFISVLTFGQTIRLYEQLLDSYIVESTIRIITINDVKKINRTGIVESKSKEIVIEEGTICSIIRKRTDYLMRNIKNTNEINDYILSTVDYQKIKEHEKKAELVPLLRSKYILLSIISYERHPFIIDTLRKLVKYRNALAHMKKLSKDAFNRFDQIKKELFTNMAFRI